MKPGSLRRAFFIRGMDCAEEIETLRSELSKMPGLGELGFDLLSQKMTVEITGRRVSDDAILAAVSQAGLTATPWSARAEGSSGAGRWGRTLATAGSGFALATGLVLHALEAGLRSALTGAGTESVPVGARFAYGAAVLLGAWFVAPKAWNALRRVRPDMNLLMCVAILGAIGIGEWFEAATVAFLFAVSLALESWSLGRARRAIAALMQLSPARARVRDSDGNEKLIDAAAVDVGTTVLVKPGERFPLDGRITLGRTTANQAPITGESLPVVKEVGSEVFAGTINEEGAVELVTIKPYADSTLSQVAKMVGEAQSRRSPSERWVERFASRYTPLVMAAALLLAVVPPLLGRPWGDAFYLASLVSAARQGVLIKGGEHVETPARLTTVALDKTGTLTEGRPVVRRVVPRSGHDERELLEIAAAVEVHSSHPLAKAVVEHATSRGVRPAPATDFQLLPGRGAHARVGGVEHWLGSHRYLEERGQEQSEIHEELEALAEDGASVVVVGRADHVCGYITLADRLRPATREALEDLRRAGVSRIVMLSGDNWGTARVIGRDAGVDEVRAELLPQDKVRVLEELERKRPGACPCMT